MANNLKVYFEGFDAQAEGIKIDGNPYPCGSQEHRDWTSGWIAGDDEVKIQRMKDVYVETEFYPIPF